MNETNQYSAQEIQDAEIVPNQGGPNAWLLRFGEGEYDIVGKSPRNRLLVEEDIDLRNSVSIRHNESLDYYNVSINENESELTLQETRDGTKQDIVTVPVEYESDVYDAVSNRDGERLRSLYDALHTVEVREGVMDMVMPLFRDGSMSVRKTDDGWLFGDEQEDDILLTWDAENHPVDVQTMFNGRGEKIDSVESSTTAREIDFNLEDEVVMNLPNGTETVLTDVEQEFLVTAGLINGIEESRAPNSLCEIIESSQVSSFVDSRSGIRHGHKITKHTVDSLNVTNEVKDRLYYNEYDHAVVHELLARRDEFQAAPIDIFTDVPDDESQRWLEVDSTSEKALIPQEVKDYIESAYE
jgi:hypothetical protein